MCFLGHKLGQTDYKSHHDLCCLKVRQDNLLWPRDFLSDKLGQTDHKCHRELRGHKVGQGEI